MLHNKDQKENIRRLIFLILSLLMMGLIFWFSAQGADVSSAQSEEVSYTVARIIKPGFSRLSSVEKADFVEKIETMIRKSAHFLEYTLLGMLLLGTMWKKKRAAVKNSLPALGIAALYSVTDEIHQSFVPGRSCEFRDMCIDTSGALTGILLILLIRAFIKWILHLFRKDTIN